MESTPPIDGEKIRWIRDVAEQKHATAQGDLYYNQQDYNKAFEFYFNAAENGFAPAQFSLGMMYRYGAIEDDGDECRYWLTLAAQQNHAEAQYRLAEIFSHRFKFDEIIALYKKSSNNGHAPAAMELGRMYSIGYKRIRINGKEALHWYQRAAELGDKDACIEIGRIYESGEILELNIDEAIRWYTEAGEQGCADGYVLIARLHEHGIGVPQDRAKQVHYIRLAADLGDRDSRIFVGGMYEWGDGVSQNYEEARRLYKLADENYSRGYETLAAFEQRLQKKEEEKNKKVDLLGKLPQNDARELRLEPSFTKEEFLDKATLFKLTAELLSAAGYAEPSSSVLARALVPLIEQYRDNPAALEARLSGLVADTTITQQAVVPPPPDTAPELYRDRPRDRKTGRQEGVDKFIAHAYAPWIIDGVLMLPPKTIRKIDPECDFAITRWRGNHKGEQFPIKLAEDEDLALTLTPEQIRAAHRLAKREYMERKRLGHER